MKNGVEERKGTRWEYRGRAQTCQREEAEVKVRREVQVKLEGHLGLLQQK